MHYLKMQKDKDKQMEWIQEKYQNVWQIPCEVFRFSQAVIFQVSFAFKAVGVWLFHFPFLNINKRVDLLVYLRTNVFHQNSVRMSSYFYST